MNVKLFFHDGMRENVLYLPGRRKSTLKGELKSNKITSFFTSFGLNEWEIVNSLERGTWRHIYQKRVITLSYTVLQYDHICYVWYGCSPINHICRFHQVYNHSLELFFQSSTHDKSTIYGTPVKKNINQVVFNLMHHFKF